MWRSLLSCLEGQLVLDVMCLKLQLHLLVAKKLSEEAHSKCHVPHFHQFQAHAESDQMSIAADFSPVE